VEELLNAAQLGLNHVQLVVRAMVQVASCDGVHETEKILIQEFYKACRQDVEGLADFDDLIAEAWSGENAKDILDTDELRQVALRSCLFLAFADGRYSEGEQQTIRRIATELDVSPEQLNVLEDQVKGVLMRQLVGVRNLDELREVYRELDSVEG